MDIHKIAKYEKITEDNIVKLTKKMYERSIQIQELKNQGKGPIDSAKGFGDNYEGNIPRNPRLMFEEDQDLYKTEEIDENKIAEQKIQEWKDKYEINIKNDQGIQPRHIRYK